MYLSFMLTFSFFFNDTATTEIYTLSLHDALPIFTYLQNVIRELANSEFRWHLTVPKETLARSEEHTSELQSQSNLVCRLLLEKKKFPQPRYFRSARPEYVSSALA